MSLLPREVQQGSGGVFGTDWPEALDRPRRFGNIWIVGVQESGKVVQDLGRNRGGHAYCGRVAGVRDLVSWWEFYDQSRIKPGQPEKDYSSCTGMAACRYVSNKNRVRYDPFDVYHAAQEIDEWPGVDYDGSSVRAAFEILRTRGPRRVRGGERFDPDPEAGVHLYFWATSTDEIRRALNVPERSALIPFLQSWGRSGYPHICHIPDEIVDRLVFRQDGEFAIGVDRP